MADNLKDLPAIPDGTEPKLKEALNRIREAVQVLRANRGDPLDAAITWRSAIAKGLAKLVGGGVGGGGSIGGGVIVIGGGGAYVPDLTPPPSVSGLTATAAISHVIVEFDAPVYTQGHGNERTEIYAVQRDPASSAPLPVFTDAVVVGAATGASPIIAIPSNPDTKWFIWAKHVTVDGVASTAPAGGTNGVQVTTGLDVSTLLVALVGQLTQSQLEAALGSRINLIDDASAVVGSVNARVLAEATARGTAITSEATTRASADSALSSTLTTLSATVGTNTAAIATESSTRASADSALSTSIATLATTVSGNTSAITTEASTRASADSALATTISGVSAVASGAAADILTEASTRASADSALSSTVSTLSSTVGGNTAAIAAEASTRASVDGGLLAQWTVKLDVNGYISGFGLASTLNNATPFSSFIIRADEFAIGNPAGPGAIAPIFPFIVVATATTLNGVALPIGVYMDAAYIRNGDITNAKIGNAQIDDAKIVNLSVAKLLAGAVAVGEYIQSTGYVAGSAGWKIGGNGFAEFDFVMVRGTLTTAQLGAGVVTASKINVTSLDAISATIGTLRTASTGARMEIQDNKIRVYDSANVCRIKFGDLS